MRWRQLVGQIAVRARVGLSVAEFELERDNRLAYPLAGVPGALLAIALALRGGRKGHVATALVESVGVSLRVLVGAGRDLGAGPFRPGGAVAGGVGARPGVPARRRAGRVEGAVVPDDLGGALAARLEEAAAVLRRGGIVVYPTETLLRARSPRGRRGGAPAAGSRQAPPRGEAASAARRRPRPGAPRRAARGRGGAGRRPALARTAHARPAGAAPVEGAVTAGSGTVGVRVPGSALARALAARAGFPLVSTSANPAGGPPPSRVSELASCAPPPGRPRAGRRPDARRPSQHGGAPRGREIRVLREGAVSLAAIAEAAR